MQVRDRDLQRGQVGLGMFVDSLQQSPQAIVSNRCRVARAQASSPGRTPRLHPAAAMLTRGAGVLITFCLSNCMFISWLCSVLHGALEKPRFFWFGRGASASQCSILVAFRESSQSQAQPFRSEEILSKCPVSFWEG